MTSHKVKAMMKRLYIGVFLMGLVCLRSTRGDQVVRLVLPSETTVRSRISPACLLARFGSALRLSSSPRVGCVADCGAGYRAGHRCPKGFGSKIAPTIV